MRVSPKRVRAVVIGDGSRSSAAEEIARQTGIEELIDFVGWRSSGEIADYLDRSRVMVVPSRWAR